MEHLLEANNVDMVFGGVRAVDGINMWVDPGEFFGIIGPNGSGKTTFFNALTGIYTPTSGKFTFKKDDITGLPLHTIASLGIARTFQNLRLFRAMSVRDNVLIGQHTQLKTGLWDAVMRTKNLRINEKAAIERANEMIALVGLEHMSNELAGSMSYGQQKRLELARAMVCKPSLLLLDEPTAGMNSVEADKLIELVQKIKKDMNISVIMIEHNMKVMMRAADRIMAMDSGKKIAEGNPQAIQVNKDVIRAYLGEEEANVTKN